MSSSLQQEAARPLAPSSLGDTTLVHLARNGDLGAFAELCQRHSWTAWETAYAVTGDTSDAAEAVVDPVVKRWVDRAHLHGRDGIAFYTDQKVVIERWF